MDFTSPSHPLSGSWGVKVFIQPLCHWRAQGEMEFDLLAIKSAPSGWVRQRFLLLVNRAKFYRVVLNTIFIARTTVL
jgi:hypothetical protein